MFKAIKTKIFSVEDLQLYSILEPIDMIIGIKIQWKYILL